MKLFVSDLDGTLLNSNKKISSYTKDTLNTLIKKGMNFTVATARTPATVINILKNININLPIILMNGVVLYDLKSKKYIKVIRIPSDISYKIISVLNKNSLNPFIYIIHNNNLLVYYNKLVNSAEINFFNERKDFKEKTFINSTDYVNNFKDKEISTVLVFGNYSSIKQAYDELITIPQITVDLYKDIYVKEDLYTLEIYSNLASKANGIQQLKEYISFNKTICFGDNINDISMFKISSECYAVKNASSKLKEIATKTIDDNNNDGVAKQLKKCI